jgi:hypothetical protein
MRSTFLPLSWQTRGWWAKGVVRLFLFAVISLQTKLYKAIYHERNTFHPLPTREQNINAAQETMNLE